MKETKTEAYFVCGHGDAPESIAFSLEDAKRSECLFIDVFNSKGEHTTAYKKMNDQGDWTKDF